MKNTLEIALLLAAIGQFSVAILNFNLPRILRWTDDLARLPLLLREVFYVHAWFISVTLLIFAAVTGRFAGELAAGAEPVYRWLACGIGAFWAVRAMLQVAYYSSSHWRGILSRTAMHYLLLAVYGGFAAVYLTAGIL